MDCCFGRVCARYAKALTAVKLIISSVRSHPPSNPATCLLAAADVRCHDKGAQLESRELQSEEAEHKCKQLDVLHIMSKVNIPCERWMVMNGIGEPYHYDV